MADFSLKRDRADAYTKEEVIAELKRVAAQCDDGSFSTRDFDRLTATCRHPAVFRIFETWERALAAIGITYKRKFTSRRKTTDFEFFQEMERIWSALGHRPARREWSLQNPKYSYRAYMERFGGWVAACGSFIEYKSGAWTMPEVPAEGQITEPALTDNTTPVKLGSREIPLKLRYKILDRDNYRCVLCGKSPATDLGVKLHIDHIVAYSKGGPTTLENLRTLCQHCNWGKGAD